MLRFPQPQRDVTDGDSWARTSSGLEEQREEALQEQLAHINILF